MRRFVSLLLIPCLLLSNGVSAYGSIGVTPIPRCSDTPTLAIFQRQALSLEYLSDHIRVLTGRNFFKKPDLSNLRQAANRQFSFIQKDATGAWGEAIHSKVFRSDENSMSPLSRRAWRMIFEQVHQGRLVDTLMGYWLTSPEAGAALRRFNAQNGTSYTLPGNLVPNKAYSLRRGAANSLVVENNVIRLKIGNLHARQRVSYRFTSGRNQFVYDAVNVLDLLLPQAYAALHVSEAEKTRSAPVWIEILESHVRSGETIPLSNTVKLHRDLFSPGQEHLLLGTLIDELDHVIRGEWDETTTPRSLTNWIGAIGYQAVYAALPDGNARKALSAVNRIVPRSPLFATDDPAEQAAIFRKWHAVPVAKTIHRFNSTNPPITPAGLPQMLSPFSNQTALTGGPDESPMDFYLRYPQRVWDSIVDHILLYVLKMIDIANKDKHEVDVGGHPGAAASSLHILVALFLFVARGWDHIAIKPHSGPVFHAIQVLLGKLPKYALYFLRLNRIEEKPDAFIKKRVAMMDPETKAEFEEFQAQLRAKLPVYDNKIGLHSYPSPRNDPDGVSFPTGPVGEGLNEATAMAVTYEWLRHHGVEVPDAHFWATEGDSASYEKSILESLNEAVKYRAKITHVIDFNRQSLDGTRPDGRVRLRRATYEANGWDVIEVRWGTRIKKAFGRADGGALFQQVMEALAEDEYQYVSFMDGAAIRQYLIEKEAELIRDGKLHHVDPALQAFLKRYKNTVLRELYTDLGGHDLRILIPALTAARKSEKPVALIVHTIKGWGIPDLIGDPQNHKHRPNDQQLADVQKARKIPQSGDPFPDFAGSSAELKALTEITARRREEERINTRIIRRNKAQFAHEMRDAGPFPDRIHPIGFDFSKRSLSTQSAWGMIAEKFTTIRRTPYAQLKPEDRAWKPYADREISASSDTGTSTGGGKAMDASVFGPPQKNWHQILKIDEWSEKHGVSKSPNVISSWDGFHFMDEITEWWSVVRTMASGKSYPFTGWPLFPYYTVYDQFLDRFAAGAVHQGQYWDAPSLIIQTPSGVTLATEGGSHHGGTGVGMTRSTPNLVQWEPWSPDELDYIDADRRRRVVTGQDGGRKVVVYRLSTLSMNRQELWRRLAKNKVYAPEFAGKSDEEIEEMLPEIEQRVRPRWKEDVLAGGYRLVDYRGFPRYTPGENVINIVTTGVMVNQALEASDELLKKGYYANVIVVTSADLLNGKLGEENDFEQLRELLPDEETWQTMTPLITLADAPPIYLEGTGGIVGVGAGSRNLGVTKNSLSHRSVELMYLHHGISHIDVIETGLVMLEVAAEKALWLRNKFRELLEPEIRTQILAEMKAEAAKLKQKSKTTFTPISIEAVNQQIKARQQTAGHRKVRAAA